jgi:hypothetical protein
METLEAVRAQSFGVYYCSRKDPRIKISLTHMYTNDSHRASDWFVNAVAAGIWVSVGKGAQALRLRTLQVLEFDVLVLSVTPAIDWKVTLRAELCEETRSEELELVLQ